MLYHRGQGANVLEITADVSKHRLRLGFIKGEQHHNGALAWSQLALGIKLAAMYVAITQAMESLPGTSAGNRPEFFDTPARRLPLGNGAEQCQLLFGQPLAKCCPGMARQAFQLVPENGANICGLSSALPILIVGAVVVLTGAAPTRRTGRQRLRTAPCPRFR